MNRLRPLRALLAGALLASATPAPVCAQIVLPDGVNQAFDKVDNALTYESPNGQFYSYLFGQVDLTQYYLGGRPYGIIYSNPSNNFLFSPRLTLNFESAYSDRLLFFAKFRWDDGFDPNEQYNSTRLDEIFLRIAILPKNLDLQVGKFATVFGAWPSQHDSWTDTFITAPLPYDQVTSVLDGFVVPNASVFAHIRNFPDNLNTWVPVIWGPEYLPGIAAFGTYGKFDLAVSGTTGALSTRPEYWSTLNFSRPSFNGRLGWRPTPAWDLGVSGSIGPYLSSDAAPFLPAGSSLSDFDQITTGGDAAWSWHAWQVSGEFIYSRFQVPNVGNADTFSWYIQTQYQVTPQLAAAIRWNQQVYNQVNTATGPQDWDNNQVRLDLALNYKWNEYILTKLEYSWQHQDASFQNGQQLVALQLIVRF
jgi:hypothetical protein